MKLPPATTPDQTASFGSAQDIVPLYHRVYLLLLQNISDRSFPPDQPMPPEADLSALMGVSRITLRKAMERLEREGLVLRQRGRGTFALPDRLPTAPAAPSTLRNQVSLALKTKVRVLDHVVVPASPVIAALLEIPAGEGVLRIVRVRSDASSPISYSVCHVPKDLARLLPRRRIGTLPISTLLAASGLVLDRFRERLSARIANMEVAGPLEVDIGSPLLSMVRMVRASDGRVVEHLQVLYRPDRYEYDIEYSGSEANDPSAPWRAKMTDRASRQGTPGFGSAADERIRDVERRG